MIEKNHPLSAEFIATQKNALLVLQEQLSLNSEASAGNEAQLQSNSLHRSEGSGDDAQKTTLRDNQAARFEHNRARLSTIARALQKIEDGSYGFSDESGDAIPKARLEVVPESLLTLDETAQAEQSEP